MKQLEIALKNFLLTFYLTFHSEKRVNSISVFSKDSKLLFIRLNRIGDALVTTPLLHAVKNNLNCKIVVLADSKNFFTYKNTPDVDQIIIFQKGAKGFRETLKLLNEMKFDAVIDLHDDVSTTVSFLISKLHIPVKFGLEKSNSKVYTNTVKRLPQNESHVIERIMQLTNLFNISYSIDECNVHYYPLKHSLKKIDDYLSKTFDRSKFILGINISAGSDARFWGVKKFRSLIDFLKAYDVQVLMLSTTRDLRSAMSIMGDNKDKIFFTPVFDEFAAMITKLDMLFSPDTATIHLASVSKIPVFGIYVQYDTDAQIWSPFQSPFDCVITQEPTLINVTFDEVIKKFKPFLEKFAHVTPNS
jgi:ADP-heptose:LPS heptosyltransferase